MPEQIGIELGKDLLRNRTHGGKTSGYAKRGFLYPELKAFFQQSALRLLIEKPAEERRRGFWRPAFFCQSEVNRPFVKGDCVFLGKPPEIKMVALILGKGEKNFAVHIREQYAA